MKVLTDLNCSNLQQEMIANPAMIPIYINYHETEHEINVELTKHKGQRLYALLEKDCDDIYKALSMDEGTKVEQKVTEQKETSGRKGKQSNLFSFMVSK